MQTTHPGTRGRFTWRHALKTFALIAAVGLSLHLAWVTGALFTTDAAKAEGSPEYVLLKHDCPFTLDSTVGIWAGGPYPDMIIRFVLTPGRLLDGSDWPSDRLANGMLDPNWRSPVIRCTHIEIVSTQPILGVGMENFDETRLPRNKAFQIISKPDEPGSSARPFSTIVGKSFSTAVIDLAAIDRRGGALIVDLAVQTPMHRVAFVRKHGEIQAPAVLNRRADVSDERQGAIRASDFADRLDTLEHGYHFIRFQGRPDSILRVNGASPTEFVASYRNWPRFALDEDMAWAQKWHDFLIAFEGIIIAVLLGVLFV